MIDFDSTNFSYTLYKDDDIDIDLFINNDRLNSIFSKYLYYKYTTVIKDRQIKVSYGLHLDAINDMLLDQSLGETIKSQLYLLFIKYSLNSLEIYILYNLKSPDNAIIIFANILNENITGLIYSATEGESLTSDGIVTTLISTLKATNIEVAGHSINDVVINYDDNTLSTKTHYTYNSATGTWAYKGELAIVDKVKLTSDDKLKLNSSYGQTFYSSTRSQGDGMVIKLNFYQHEYYIILYANVKNYTFMKELIDLLDIGDIYFNDNVFSYKQCSYVIYHNYAYHYESYFKFTIPDITGLSDEETIWQPYGILQLQDIDHLKMYATNNYRRFNYHDKFLYNYLYEKNGDSDIILSISNYENMIDNIKELDNYNLKQYEYFDLSSVSIADTIGEPSGAALIDIIGYDDITNKYFILYISNEFDVGGIPERIYKIVKGGVTPINNLLLKFKHDESYEVIQTKIITGSIDENLLDNFLYLAGYVQGNNYSSIPSNFEFTEKFDVKFDSLEDYSEFLDSPLLINGEVNMVYNLSEYEYIPYIDKTLIKKVYEVTYNMLKKQPYPIMVDSLDVIPYQIIPDIVENGSDNNSVINILKDEYFLSTDNVSKKDVKLENLFISFYPFTEFKKDKNFFIYLYNKSSPNIYKIFTHRYMLNFITELNSNVFKKILESSEQIKYNFANIDDIISVKKSHQVSDDEYLDYLVSDMTSISYFDTTNTTRDDLMSELLGIDTYGADITSVEGKNVMAIFDIDKVSSMDDNIFLLNKVIGLDQLAYFGMYTDINDETFSEYLTSSLTLSNNICAILDIDNSKISFLSTNILKLSASSTNPILFDKISLAYDKFVIFNKEEYNKLISNYNYINNIEEFTPIQNIEYATKPVSITNGLGVNFFSNDKVILR